MNYSGSEYRASDGAQARRARTTAASETSNTLRKKKIKKCEFNLGRSTQELN